MSSYYVFCGLPGGLPGNYSLFLKFEGVGAVAVTPGENAFRYETTITAVSPSTGSYFGNTLLTITGTNFLTGSGETLVYIGSATNWFCKIQSITSSQITCLTPPDHPSYGGYGTSVQVIASSKLTTFNTCP